MRQIIALIGLLTILLGCVETTADKPKVKSLTILTRIYPLWLSEDQANEIKNKDTLYLKHYEEFDSLGNIVVEKLRGGDVNWDLYYKNNYAPSGLLLSRNCSGIKDFERSSLDTFIYNTNKQLAKEIHLGLDRDTTRTYAYEYNTDGQKLSKLDLDPQGYSLHYEYVDNKLVKEFGDFHQWIFLYSSRGELSKQILFYDTQDTVASKSYTYNDLGQIVQITRYDYTTKTATLERMTYNSQGYIDKKNDNGEELIYVYEYFK